MKSFDVVAETRRRWPPEERQQIIAESESAPVSVVARRHGVAVSLVFRWRRQAGLPGKRNSLKKPAPMFVPVVLPASSTVAAAPEKPPVQVDDRGLIEIGLSGGRVVRLSGPVDGQALKRVIAILEGR